MTFPEYLVACSKAQCENPSWRWGQTLFNTLWSHRTILAAEVGQTHIDPFYTEDREVIKAFLTYVEENW